MPPADRTPEHALDHEMLQLILKIAAEMSDVRERLIRLEAHGQTEVLAKLQQQAHDNEIRLSVLETKGSIFAAGVAAAVSVGVSVFSALLAFFFKH